MPRQAALWTSKASQRRARTRLGGEAGSAPREPGTWACGVTEGGALRAPNSGCAVARVAKGGSEGAAAATCWREGGASCAPTSVGKRSAGVGRALPALWLEADGAAWILAASAGAHAPPADLAVAWGRPSACAAWCRSLLVAAREAALGPRVEADMAEPFAKRHRTLPGRISYDLAAAGCTPGRARCEGSASSHPRNLSPFAARAGMSGGKHRPCACHGAPLRIPLGYLGLGGARHHEHVFAAVVVAAMSVLSLAQHDVIAKQWGNLLVRTHMTRAWHLRQARPC